MRILGVRLRNLNSLAGEWELDFTLPEFAGEGIFAVTGPTGAGKSTIFDAVCLALYGATPRLGKISRNSNEIMSRHSGSCFAEVLFRAGGATYRCQWSQRRAKDSPGGQLQAPQQVLEEAESGTPVARGPKDVGTRLEEITGLDFSRFTRSMLLAQGDFAAFLQAPADQKAPILEQITGTDLYRRISEEVHKRYAALRMERERREEQLAGAALPAEEEETALLAALAEKGTREAAVNARILAGEKETAWLTGLAALERESAELETARESLEAEQAAFAPQKALLELDKKAGALAPEHTRVSELRAEQERESAALARDRTELTERETALEQAETGLTRAGRELDALRAANEALSRTLQRIRFLDQSLAGERQRLAALAPKLAEAEKSLAELRAADEAAGMILSRLERDARAHTRFAAENAADAALVEDLAGITADAAAIRALHAAVGEADTALLAVESAGVRDAAALEEARGRLAALDAAFAKAGETLAERRAEAGALLGNHDLAWWRERAQALRDYASLDTSRAARRERLTALDAERERLAGRLLDDGAALEKAEAECLLVEKRDALLREIRSLEDARTRLVDGQACPLCGALHHPFAEGRTPAEDGEAGAELRAAKNAVKQLNESLGTARTEAAKVEAEYSLLAEGVKDAESRLSRMREALGDEESAALPELEDKIRTVEEAERDAARLREERESGLKERHEAGSAAAILEERVRHGANDAERLRRENAARRDDLAARARRLGDSARTWGALPAPDSPAFITGLAGLLAELERRKGAWLAAAKEEAERAEKMQALRAEKAAREGTMRALDGECAALRKERDSLGKAVEELTRERRERFGDKDADTEERNASRAAKKAETALDAARRQREHAALARETVRTRESARQSGIAERGARLGEAEERFSRLLAANGFAHEAAFGAARLPEEERAALQMAERKLETRELERASRLRAVLERLAAEREKALSDRNRAEAGQELAALREEHKALLEARGGIAQRLAAAKEAGERHHALAARLDALRADLSRWGLLHELIGSHDGAKFRNFAQGLTLENVVARANRELRRMSDRYLLVRDPNQPLELNVADGYQAGEVRSVKTLSGGESFIISLALALGLAQIAGQNVRVDSLFLDEGFGTLDEDALDMALSALGGLRQEGKLIGVISHVPALRERIATRIDVIPRAEGRSAVQGPGCRENKSAA